MLGSNLNPRMLPSSIGSLSDEKLKTSIDEDASQKKNNKVG
jgi:hypothetical protein